MNSVTSKDGTTIAYDLYGQGQAIILVGGAVQHRAIDAQSVQLATILAKNFTVIHYDRRGRGDSGNTQPFEIAREIEDIGALIDPAGGSAYVFGMSSGAALAMEAAIELPNKIQKLAMYEPPYNDDPASRQGWREYRRNLEEALAEGRRGDAAALFLKLVGTPAEAIEGMRGQPFFQTLEAIAPTLAYDAAVMGEESAVPTERAARVTVPALVITGGATYPFMHVSAKALVDAMPNAKHLVLEGQTHDVSPEVLAPVLEDFFAA